MQKIICIVGPTGIGKTKLSIELAKYFDAEIINADSTQIYKGLDIGTAKVKEEEKQGIVHHLIDIKNISDNYTAYDYQKDCRKSIEIIQKKGKIPIIVGGTGLYIKSSLYDYDFKEENKINYDNLSLDKLYDRLLTVDPNTDIHKNNRKRVERALNYYEINHVPLSEKEKTSKILYDVIFIGLTTSREILYDKINDRVDLMIKDGLIEETKKIYDSGIRTKAVLTPIGYKELFDYFEHKKKLEECVKLIKQKSRNYAKRQYTWFNNQMDVQWFNTDFEHFNNTVLQVIDYIKKY